jgi:hypothetical protein
LKKPAGSIRFRFRFYKLETKKTEPNRTQTEKTESNKKKPIQTKKPSQTGKIEPKPVGLNRFRFFFKKFLFSFFFYKNRIENNYPYKKRGEMGM